MTDSTAPRDITAADVAALAGVGGMMIVPQLVEQVATRAYAVILRTSLPTGFPTTTPLDLFPLEAALLTQAQNSTLPALIAYQALLGSTPLTSAGLDYLAHYANSLSAQGYSTQNIYVNFGASFIGQSSSAALYASESRADFLTNAYTDIFGHAPSQDAANYLLGTFDYYQSFTGSDLGAKGAVYGAMLSMEGSHYTAQVEQNLI